MGADQSSTILQDPPAKPGETPIICSPNYEKVPQTLKDGLFDDFPEGKTMYHIFEDAFKRLPDQDMYGERVYEEGKWQDRFEFVTRREFREIRDCVGSFLIKNGFSEKSTVGILSFNKIQWVATQHACFAYGYYPVPIYDTYGPEGVDYIISHAETKIIFVVSTKLKLLLQLKNPNVTHIVVFDAKDHPYDESEFKELLNDCNYTIVKWSEVVSIKERYPHRPPTPDEPASIMYTSGTTGPPKGCVMSHANFVATASSFVKVYPFSENDTYLSFLPLAHSFEECLHFVGNRCCIKVAFYSGDIRRLMEEIKLYKPSLLVSVSRIFERLYDGMQKTLSQKPFMTRLAFNTAFSIKSFLTRHFRIQKVPILDLMFDKINQAAVGGNMKMVICGGSALSVEIQHFLRIALNVSFPQGYGLTETASGVTVQNYKDTLDGNVGVLLHCVQAKMKDIPDMGYYAKNYEGELFLRGATMFKGYYKDEEKTKETYDDEGWFKTGDIFKLTKSGQFLIVGRVKELVKLSQGEYISLTKLTKIYVETKFINQIYIHAGMQSRFLVAIVVLDKAQSGYDKVTVDQMLTLLKEKAAEMKLKGFERISNVKLITDEFTPQNGLLTPSLKLVSYKIEKKYEKEIKELIKVNRLLEISQPRQHLE